VYRSFPFYGSITDYNLYSSVDTKRISLVSKSSSSPLIVVCGCQIRVFILHDLFINLCPLHFASWVFVIISSESGYTLYMSM
jgi:hypothetical protein